VLPERSLVVLTLACLADLFVRNLYPRRDLQRAAGFGLYIHRCP
jgi:hypothetical protein